MLRHFLITVACFLSLLVSGCAEWTDSRLIESTSLTPPQTSTLPKPKVSGDTWVVDVAFVQLEEFSEQHLLWNSIDETVLSAALRQELLINGLRAGRLIGQPVDYLAALNDAEREASPLQVLEQAGVASELSHIKRRLSCRPNQPYPLPTRAQTKDTNVALLWEKAGEVTGRSLQTPHTQFEMTIEPKPDGQARVRLQPIVEHGELKNNWIGQEQAIVKKLQREKLPLEHLAMEIELAPSQIFVVGATSPAVSIGRLMLQGERADGKEEQTILLIRIAGASQIECDPPVLATN